MINDSKYKNFLYFLSYFDVICVQYLVMLNRSISIFYLWCLHYTIVSISISRPTWRQSHRVQ